MVQDHCKFGQTANFQRSFIRMCIHVSVYMYVGCAILRSDVSLFGLWTNISLKVSRLACLCAHDLHNCVYAARVHIVYLCYYELCVEWSSACVICVHICLHMYMCAHVCVCVCLCVHLQHTSHALQKHLISNICLFFKLKITFNLTARYRYVYYNYISFVSISFLMNNG